MQFERIILLVLDSVGIGAMPDAANFGDKAAHTLGHIAQSQGGLAVPYLEKLGLGAIEQLQGIKSVTNYGCYGKMQEISCAKDTTSGHWEIAGCPVFQPFPTYPQGFPDELMAKFKAVTGYDALGNYPASGTVIITELGETHLETGQPIVYTSADSVFQIAAHEDIIPVEKLYELCQKVRSQVCVGPHAVGRVIARPFVGPPGNFIRTPRRHDFSLPPHDKTVLEELKENDYDVIGIGKIHDIFAGTGLTESQSIVSNQDGMNKLLERVKLHNYKGLIFVNLVDFDSLYGHRRDPAGYKTALEQFDLALASLLNELTSQELLLITADHGCDPTAPGSDHTREFVPLLAYSPGVIPQNLGVRKTFADIGALIAENFSLHPLKYGVSFLSQLEVVP